jgi:hypothetical protein
MAIVVFLCSMYLVHLPLAFFCIEAGPAAVVTEVGEVVDSDVESETGVESDGEDATARTPRRPLRQLTLLE